MGKILFALLATALIVWASDAPAQIAGDWTMSLETPHGTLSGPLKIEQDGAKLSGSYETEHAGKLALTGKVEGQKVTFSMEAPGGMTLTFNGTVEGGKMSGKADPFDGAWSASKK